MVDNNTGVNLKFTLIFERRSIKTQTPSGVAVLALAEILSGKFTLQHNRKNRDLKCNKLGESLDPEGIVKLISSMFPLVNILNY